MIGHQKFFQYSNKSFTSIRRPILILILVFSQATLLFVKFTISLSLKTLPFNLLNFSVIFYSSLISYKVFILIYLYYSILTLACWFHTREKYQTNLLKAPINFGCLLYIHSKPENFELSDFAENIYFHDSAKWLMVYQTLWYQLFLEAFMYHTIPPSTQQMGENNFDVLPPSQFFCPSVFHCFLFFYLFVQTLPDFFFNRR